MKTTTLLLALSLSMGMAGCTDTSLRVRETSPCVNGERRYTYAYGNTDYYFYAPCDAYHIGDRLFTDSLTTKK